MSLIGGMATFIIDGRAYSTPGEFEIKIQNEQWEPVPDSAGNIHRTSKITPSTISGEILLTPDLKQSTIAKFSNSTIQVRLLKEGSESIASLKDAFFTGEPTVTTQDGKMKVEFSGKGLWIS